MEMTKLEQVVRDALKGIKSLIEERYELEQKLEAVSQTLAHERASIVVQVASEKDENGKKRFSNEAEREAQALLLEDGNEDVRAMKREVAMLLTKRRYIDAMIEYHQLRIQAATALLNTNGSNETCKESSNTEESETDGESQSPRESLTKSDLERMKRYFWGQE